MSETKTCPFCRETIIADAIKCRYCGSMLDGSSPYSTTGNGGHPGRGGLLDPGDVVDRYQIVKILGQGGMGVVYEAVHQYTEQRVALKAIWPNLMMDKTSRKRFLEEGRTMARLKHNSIVSLHNFFEDKGNFYLVMEFIEGRPLDAILESARPMPGRPTKWLSLKQILQIGKDVSSALAHAHEQNQSIVHRDIKPGNIMVREDNSAVVMDFGIAKAIGREKLTRTRGVVGTYEYMSPEQVTGDDVSDATDMYAFGIVMYELLSGFVPFPQRTDTGIDCMDAHRNKQPDPIPDQGVKSLKSLNLMVMRCLSKQPARRPSAAEVEKLLNALLAGEDKDANKIADEQKRPTPSGAVPIAIQRTDPKIGRSLWALLAAIALFLIPTAIWRIVPWQYDWDMGGVTISRYLVGAVFGALVMYGFVSPVFRKDRRSYRCGKCGSEFSGRERWPADKVSHCPNCGTKF